MDVTAVVLCVVVVAAVLADVADCEPDPEVDGVLLVLPVPVDSSPSPSEAAPEAWLPPPAQPEPTTAPAMVASATPVHRSLVNVGESLIPSRL